MQLKVNFIDAFTDTPFRGNPAAVVVTKDWLPATLMQSIAIENNLSETAFAVKKPEGDYEIRWFSPLTEIAFCGHATLAAAFVLFNEDSTLQELSFFAKAVGTLSVRKGANGYMQMSFPNKMPERIDEIPADLQQGLSIQPYEVYRSPQAYFAVYHRAEQIIAVTQNTDYIKKLAPYDVVVTAAAKDYDFISRYFWPANGSDEDPVTGSIHAGLAPLWAHKLGKRELSAYQASARGGKLSCFVDGERVLISGQAVQYLEGYINV